MIQPEDRKLKRRKSAGSHKNGIALLAVFLLILLRSVPVLAKETDSVSATLSGNVPVFYGIQSTAADADTLDEVLKECEKNKIKTEVRDGKVIMVGRTDYLPENLEIPEGVAGIEAGFLRDTTVKTLMIPSSVKYIDSQVFMSSYIENVTFREGIEEIGKEAFYGCKKLKHIELPDSLVNIGEGVFYGASALETVKLPQNIENIPRTMFYVCSSLKEIKIPAHVKFIGLNAFAGTGLEEFDLTGTEVEILEGQTCENCSSLKKVVLNEGLKQIGYSAFARCSNLETVVFPSGSLESIGVNAFRSSFPEKILDLSQNPLKEIGMYAFYEAALEEVKLPDTLTKVEDGAFSKCRNMKRINIPAGLVTIGVNAFNFEGNVLENEELVIPSGVTSIGNNAFSCWRKLKVIDFTKARNLVQIGEYPFSNLMDDLHLDSLKIPYSMLDGSCSVAANAFAYTMYCKNLSIDMTLDAPDKEALRSYREMVFESGFDTLKSYGLKTDLLTSLTTSLNGEEFDIIDLEYQNKIAESYFNDYKDLTDDELWENSFLAGNGKSDAFSYGGIVLGDYLCDNFYDLCLDLVKSGNIEFLDADVRLQVDELIGRLFNTAGELSAKLPESLTDLKLTDEGMENEGGE